MTDPAASATQGPRRAAPASLVERLYDAVVEEGDTRTCGELDEATCRALPANFFRYSGSLVLTKLADAVASPKTTLTWVMSAVGAPGWLIGLLVPIRESGSMLPQVFTAGPIRRRPRRKGIWVAGSLLQALAVMAIGSAVLAAAGGGVGGTATGGWIVGGLALFSLSRSLSSIASKDVKGRVIPKTRRGRSSGLAASVSGVLVLAVSLGLLALRREAVPIAFYGWFLIGAGGLWLVAAAIFSRIREPAGETADRDEGRGSLAERIGLLRSDPVFTRFVVTRALLMSTALASPYYVLLTRQNAGDRLSLLALFLLASGLATSLTSDGWGRWADRSARRVLIVAACLASGLGVGFFALLRLLPERSSSAWLYLGGFFLLGVAHSGVRIGRKTYVVDMAKGNRRTDYVAVSNTLIGALLLASGALGPLVEVIGADGMLLLLAVMGFAGAGLALTLPEVEEAGR